MPAFADIPALSSMPIKLELAGVSMRIAAVGPASYVRKINITVGLCLSIIARWSRFLEVIMAVFPMTKRLSMANAPAAMRKQGRHIERQPPAQTEAGHA